MPSLVVKAGPGTGKSFTIETGINYAFCDKLPEGCTPSDEQLNIWNWIKDHSPANADVVVLAFNKSIAEEMQRRLSYGEAKTIHSLGASLCFSNLRKQVRGKVKVDSWKTANIFCAMKDVTSTRGLDKTQREILDDVKKAVSICKARVLTHEMTEEEFIIAITDRDYEPDTAWDVLYEHVCHILKVGTQDEAWLQKIDFDDMIYLPNLFGWKRSFDVLCVDEAQDLDYGKRTFLLNQDCDVYVFVGDSNQAIYAFAGADSNSLDLAVDATDAEILPLSQTFRCGTAIVDYAQQYLTDGRLVAAPGAHKGSVQKITHDKMLEQLKPGDLCMSRVNAPLLSLAWSLLRQRKPVSVNGGNLGKNLKNIIKKLTGSDDCSLDELNKRVYTWYDVQLNVIRSRRGDTTDAEIRLEDQLSCILFLITECDSVAEILKTIKDLFEVRKTNCIQFSSIHRAKGLEAENCYWYNPANTPHKMATTPEAKAQERNLQFVAVTRAIENLYLVEPPEKNKK